MTRLALLVVALTLAACADDATPAADATGEPTARETSTATTPAQPVSDTLVVYKSPSCGCCRLWEDHMRGEGFAVVSRDVTNLQAVKDSLGVPAAASSCHTGVVGGYVVEGHVPASEVRRLLRERPDGRGIAVAGMPIGSPGMEQGDRRDAYDVLLIADGAPPTVFAHIPGHP